jgi:hypothetical protein
MKNRLHQKRIRETIPVDCRDFHMLDRDFLKGKLSPNIARIYVKHMRTCKECMEDLRAYFMFYFAAHALEDKDNPDMPTNIEACLARVEAEDNLRKKRLRNRILMAAVLAAGVAALIIFILR